MDQLIKLLIQWSPTTGSQTDTGTCIVHYPATKKKKRTCYTVEYFLILFEKSAVDQNESEFSVKLGIRVVIASGDLSFWPVFCCVFWMEKAEIYIFILLLTKLVKGCMHHTIYGTKMIMSYTKILKLIYFYQQRLNVILISIHFCISFFIIDVCVVVVIYCYCFNTPTKHSLSKM